jgi:phosphoglycerate kinase
MNLKYKTLNDLPDISGKKVLVRFDFNVPIKDGKVVDDYRIKKSLPTLNFFKDRAAKIIIISHIENSSDTLKPVFEYLKNSLSLPVSFCEDCIEDNQALISEMKPGDIILCENIRLYDGEKKNDEDFAKKLASLGDFFVNDAFSVSHRAHASVVGIPKFLPSFAGFQLEAEIKNLSQAFNPPTPFLFILGGAKFDTKLPLVQKFLSIATTIFIGGALAHDFYKAQGFDLGKSKVYQTDLDLTALISNPKIIIQPDVIAVSAQGKKEKKPQEVESDETILDAGEESISLLRKLCSEAKCILWNGPLGNYENGYMYATQELAKIISAEKALSIVGGGDTLAAIADLGIEDTFGFVSTGGGAMLDFLALGTLPGIEALKQK